MAKLKTFMSPVCYIHPTSAYCPIRKPNNHEDVYWLDELLDGGIEIPDQAWKQANKEPPFILLLAGSPGTGKSTFALELCYQLARNVQPTGGHMRSLYVSSESRTDRIIENAKAFGWEESYFKKFEPNRRLEQACCTVYGSERTAPQFESDPDNFFKTLIKEWRVFNRRTVFQRNNLAPVDDDEPFHPEIVVIDSLNILQPDPSFSHVYQQPLSSQPPAGRLSTPPPQTQLKKTLINLLAAITDQPKSPMLLILVLDGFAGAGTHSSWEYLVDGAFRFDWSFGAEDYYIRSFQILKLKMQEHVWGRQIFKIYSRQRRTISQVVPWDSGGTYIFPSVHWHLDRSDRFSVTFETTEPYSTGLDGLDSILKRGASSGFPASSTTALVGQRGALKSHLAYYFMLKHLIGIPKPTNGIPHPKNVLLISLRDDDEGAKAALNTIVDQQQLLKEGAAEFLVDEMIRSDRLEILYNAPGCITPEEFFHRVFLALTRKRRQEKIEFGDVTIECPERDTAEIVILNGLDHLEAKFPLCANERVFVPALTTMFRKYKVCSVVISADDGTTDKLAQIRPMSDLILEFESLTLEPRPEIDVAHVQGIRAKCSVPPSSQQEVQVTATRVPAGQLGGKWGILSRDSSGRMSFFHPE